MTSSMMRGGVVLKFLYDCLRWYGFTLDDIGLITKIKPGSDIDVSLNNTIGANIMNIMHLLRINTIPRKFYLPHNAIKKSKELISIIPNRPKSIINFGSMMDDVVVHLGSYYNSTTKLYMDLEEWDGVRRTDRKHFIAIKDLDKVKGTFDLILCEHVLHHATDKEIKHYIQHFHRLLSDKGVLILKEHNCSGQFKYLLDIQHVLYDVVISKIKTIDEYGVYSNYKSRTQWNELLSNKFNAFSYKFNKTLDKSYYEIYRKKK